MRIVSFVFILLFPILACSQSQNEQVPTSPKDGWGEFEVAEKEEPTVLTQVLLWLPNRLADFIDIFRLDVGAGNAYGGITRISSHFQVGYRKVNTKSVRVGVFGRDKPWLVEGSDEIGISPNFKESRERKVCNSEIGVGADIFVGVYGGICLQETADFLAGIFLIDLNDDDWE